MLSHRAAAALPRGAGGTGVTTKSALDATGARTAVTGASLTGYLGFDLHGNTALAENGSKVITDALRYDAWGELIASTTSALPTPWRYQGRLDVGPDTSNPLYDFGARDYRPVTGAFTSLDSYAGTAIDPLSMNRFLYAEANPATFVDPDGHGVDCGLGEQCSATDRSSDLAASSALTAPKPKPKSVTGGAGGPPIRRGLYNPDSVAWAMNPNELTANTLRYDCFWGSSKACELYNDPASYGLGPSRCELDPIGCLSFLLGGFLFVGSGPAVTSGAGAAIDAGQTAATAIATTLTTLGANKDRVVAAVDASEQAAIEYATQANKLVHFFGDPNHRLDPLIAAVGSETAAVRAVLSSLSSLPLQSGIFEETLTIAGQTVVARGAIVDGIIKLGTFFIPPH